MLCVTDADLPLFLQSVSGSLKADPQDMAGKSHQPPDSNEPTDHCVSQRDRFPKGCEHQMVQAAKGPVPAPRSEELILSLIGGSDEGPREGAGPSSLQIRFCAPELTAACRLRAEAPVRREASRSSWHGLIEQSRLCKCGQLQRVAGAGWVGKGGWIWEARGMEAKACRICKWVESKDHGFGSDGDIHKAKPLKQEDGA